MISNELLTIITNERVDNEIKNEWEQLIKNKDFSTLSYWYFTGNGVKTNVEMAVKLMEKVIEDFLNKTSDNSNRVPSIICQCYFELGNMHYVLRKLEKSKTCYQESRRYYEMTSSVYYYKEENEQCLNQLYKEKKAIENDISIAQLHLLAINGISLAQLKLAIFYFNKKNLRDKASVWFRKLANKGDLEAQCFLGLCYFDYYLELPSRFDDTAYKWLKGAAEKGNRDAQYFLASMLEYSKKNWDPDDNEKNEWAIFKLSLQNYYNSAEQGNVMAIKHLCGKPYDHFHGSFESKIEREISQGERIELFKKARNHVTPPYEMQVLEKNHKRFLENEKEIYNLLSQIAKYYNKQYAYERGSEEGDIASQYELLKIFMCDKKQRKNKSEEIQKVIKMILKNPDKGILEAWPYGFGEDPLFSELYGWFAYESQDYPAALGAFLHAINIKKSNTTVDINSLTYAYLGNMYYYGKGVEQDTKIAAEYYNKIDSFDREDAYTIGIEARSACRKIEEEKYKSKKNKSKNSGCFITTAVCYSFHKNDDCYELNLFRNYRDNWLINQPGGMNLVKKYYDVAPKIVDSINNCSDSEKIYFKIWKEYLRPCIIFIENEKYEECKNLYMLMVNKLKDQFLK